MFAHEDLHIWQFVIEASKSTQVETEQRPLTLHVWDGGAVGELATSWGTMAEQTFPTIPPAFRIPEWIMTSEYLSGMSDCDVLI